MKQKKNKTPSQNSTVTNAKGAGTPRTPVAAINLPNAAITPQEQIQKKINNLQKKLDEIEKLDVCPFFILFIAVEKFDLLCLNAYVIWTVVKRTIGTIGP